MDSNKIKSIKMNFDDFLIDHVIQSTFLKEGIINKNRFNNLPFSKIGKFLSETIKNRRKWKESYELYIDIDKLLNVIGLDSTRGWNYIINNKRYELNNFYQKLSELTGIECCIKILMCSYQSVFYYNLIYLNKIINNGKNGVNIDYRIKDNVKSIFNVFINIDNNNNNITIALNKIFNICSANDENDNCIKVVYTSININLTKNVYESEFIVFPNISIENNYLNIKNNENNINRNFKRDLSQPEEGQKRAWSYYFFLNKNNFNKKELNIMPQTEENCLTEIQKMDISKILEIKYLISQIETVNTLRDIIHIENPFRFSMTNDNCKKKIFYNKIYNNTTIKTFFQSYYIYTINYNENIFCYIHVYQILNITDNILERYYVFDNLNIKELIELKFTYRNNVQNNIILDNILKLSNTLNPNSLSKLNKILSKITIDRLKPNNNNISTFLNNITQSLPTLNKRYPPEQSDFLLISFNEAAESYNYSDCLPIIIKVLTEKPKIIVVCTQDSASKRIEFLGATHFQHVLGEILKNLEYEVIEKVDGSSTNKNIEEAPSTFFGKFAKSVTRTLTVNSRQVNKGIRTRIYFLSEFKDTQESREKLSESKQLLLGKFTELSLYDGAILTKLNFKVSEKDYKIAVVNCNLFYKHQSNTGITKRTEEFHKIVNDFNLIDLNKEYDIFFCGDTNFRLFIEKKPNNQISEVNILRQLVRTYIRGKTSLNNQNELHRMLFDNEKKYKKNLQNNKNEVNSRLNQIEANEKKKVSNNPDILHEHLGKDLQKLYRELKTKQTDLESKLKNTNFYKKLLESMKLLGTHLTSKYMVDKKNYMVDKKNYMYKKQLELFRKVKKNIINNELINNELINSVFKIESYWDKNIRVPSQTDRILFSLKDKTSLAINAQDFNIHIFPDKSDHKMISLTFKFNSYEPLNNLNNRHISPGLVGNENNSVINQNIEKIKEKFVNDLFSLINTTNSTENNTENFKKRLNNIHTKYNTNRIIEKESLKSSGAGGSADKRKIKSSGAGGSAAKSLNIKSSGAGGSADKIKIKSSGAGGSAGK